MPLDPRTLAAAAEHVGEIDPAKAGEAMKQAAHMADLKDTIDGLSDELRACKEEYDVIRKDTLPELMNEAGMVNAAGKGSFTLADGRKVHLQGDLHVHVPKEHTSKFHAWLKKKGHGDLIKDTVFYATLRAFVKEQTAEGNELPDELESFPFLKAVLRKA